MNKLIKLKKNVFGQGNKTNWKGIFIPEQTVHEIYMTETFSND